MPFHPNERHSLPTLLFCTSYMESPDAWERRYLRWMDFYDAVPLNRKASFLIDDASPFVPVDPRLSVIEALPDALHATPYHLFRFPNRLGRGNVVEHWGWWRSFLYSLTIARRYGCRKIIHVESDAFLLSPAVVEYLNALDTGWTAFWCPRYSMPEAAIQVIAEDQFPAMQQLADVDVRTLARTLAEARLPFTHINKSFVGNRYGEFRRAIPVYADFACQIDARTIPVAFRSGNSRAP